MKILIHSNGPHVPSGYGKQARYAGKILRELGHEVAFSCFSGLSGQPIRWDGYTLLPSGMLDFSPDVLVPHAMTMGADLVIPIMDFYKLAPAAGDWHRTQHNMKMAAFIITDSIAANGGPSMLDQRTLPMFGAHPVGVSQFGMDRLKALGYGQGEFGCSHLPHAVDTSIYKPVGNKADLRKELGTPGEFVIGIMGANRDVLRKNFQGQFAAFSRFSKKHKDAYLAVFSVTDSPSGLPLVQMAEDMGISDRVVFMPGYEQVCGMAPEEMVAAWYNSLDVLSLCSYGEGFGVPGIEAQACGTPLVATDGSAMTELARPAGWLVKGKRWWNYSHRAWWVQPDEDEIVKAWEKAYQAAGDETRRARAVAFASAYSVEALTQTHWAPFMREMEELVSGNERVVEAGGLKWHYADGFMYGDRLALSHESALEEHVFKGLPEDGVFLDVGAHVGHYALRAAKRCRRVIAVEANPKTVERLQANLELNKIKNVGVYSMAAWDSADVLTLTSKHGHDYDGTDSLVPNLEDASKVDEIRVNADRLDNTLSLAPKIHVIKIDVEGADLHVLRGLTGIIEQDKPRLFIEDHSVYGYYERADLDALLDSLGYVTNEPISGYIEALPKG